MYVAGGVFFAALLVFYVFVVRQPSTAPTSKPSPLPSPIVHAGSASVGSLTLRAKDKAGNPQVLTLTRAGSGWTYSLCPPDQTDCPTQPGDSTKTTNLVDAVVSLRPSRTLFGAPENLSAYGLDSPSTAEIDIVTTGNKTIVLFVGAKAIDKASYFVKLKDSSDVFVVDAGAVDSAILDAVTNPPKPQPSPLPVPTPSPSPIVGPVTSPSP